MLSVTSSKLASIMASFCRNQPAAQVALLIVSIACLSTFVSAAADAKDTKLPWDRTASPSGPATPQASVAVDPEILQALIELQEIVMEGIPLALKLYNKISRNLFAKPLLEVLLTCDKLNFMESCLQGIVNKVSSIIVKKKQAQPSSASSSRQPSAMEESQQQKEGDEEKEHRADIEQSGGDSKAEIRNGGEELKKVKKSGIQCEDEEGKAAEESLVAGVSGEPNSHSREGKANKTQLGVGLSGKERAQTQKDEPAVHVSDSSTPHSIPPAPALGPDLANQKTEL